MSISDDDMEESGPNAVDAAETLHEHTETVQDEVRCKLYHRKHFSNDNDFPMKWEVIMYVIMLILEFFDFSDFFYISGRVTMSTLRIRGCLSVRPSVAR